jgi:hypothetical protein
MFRTNPTAPNARKAADLLWPVLTVLYEARAELKRGENVAQFCADLLRSNDLLRGEVRVLRAEIERLKAGMP